MQPNELENGFAFFGVEIQASEECICQFDALAGVLASAARFAGVVQQEGQQEEIKAVDSGQELGQAFFVF